MDIWKRLDYIGNSLSEFSYRDVRSLMKMACAITLPHVYRLGWNWCQLYHVQIVADLCCDIYKQKDSSVMINPLYSYLFIGNIVARKKKKRTSRKVTVSMLDAVYKTRLSNTQEHKYTTLQDKIRTNHEPFFRSAVREL